jgi:hypothetical protein
MLLLLDLLFLPARASLCAELVPAAAMAVALNGKSGWEARGRAGDMDDSTLVANVPLLPEPARHNTACQYGKANSCN